MHYFCRNKLMKNKKIKMYSKLVNKIKIKINKEIMAIKAIIIFKRIIRIFII